MAEAPQTKDVSGNSGSTGSETPKRSVVDRRSGIDVRGAGVVERRSNNGVDRRDATGLKRLRGPGRRRPEFNRAAEEGEFTDEQFLFVMAINAFKAANQKSFPAWTEVLEVIRRLGYRKTQASQLNLSSAPDWTEASDSPAMPVSAEEERVEDLPTMEEWIRGT